MKAPGTAYDDPVLGKDPQPAHMNDYVHTTEDNGGVHTNSGIPNHAFYLAATDLGRLCLGEGRPHLVRDAARPATAADRPVPHLRPAHPDVGAAAGPRPRVAGVPGGAGCLGSGRHHGLSAGTGRRGGDRVQDVPVRVEVERSGGFAGIVTRRRADTADLPPAEAGGAARARHRRRPGGARAEPGQVDAGTSCLRRRGGPVPVRRHRGRRGARAPVLGAGRLGAIGVAAAAGRGDAARQPRVTPPA